MTWTATAVPSIIDLLAPATCGELTIYSYNVWSRDAVENNETINIFPATTHAITSVIMKERGRRKSDKIEVKPKKFIWHSSLAHSLDLSNRSAHFVLILCKFIYLITRIAELVMSDMEQQRGRWRNILENSLCFVSLKKHFSDNPIKSTT